MAAASVDCVVFDLDGTLYPADAAYGTATDALCAEAERRIGIPRGEFREAVAKAGRAQWDADHRTAGYHSRIVRCQLVLEERGLPLRHAMALDRAYWDAYLAAIRPYPDAAGTLSALKARGVRIGLGTNMTAGIQYRKLETLGLVDFFDFVLTSEEAGIEKPAPEFFAACVAKARCPAARCLFVGDNPDVDACAAREAGLRAAWFEPDPAKRAARPELPAVAALSGVLELLR